MPKAPEEIIRFVDLKAQYETIAGEIDAALAGVLNEAQFILGPRVERFEGEFAKYIGAAHAVGVNSGYDALELGLRALEVGAGDEVLVPASTYIATALAVSAVGATPVLVDCDPGTYDFDASALRRAVTGRTRAIMPVHLAGQACDMDAVMSLAREKGLLVVEDVAQAHGARWKGRRAGSFGALGAFSFYPGKNLGCYGDGGAVVTDDGALAERIRRLRYFGQAQKSVHLERAGNAKLDAIQAAALSVKLPRLDGWNERRARHAAQLRRLLEGVGDLRFQSAREGATHVYHLFMVETDRRDALRAHLERAGVETGVHYLTPIHLQPAYSDLGLGPGSFPNAEARCRRTLSLPMFPELQDAQLERVARELKRFFR